MSGNLTDTEFEILLECAGRKPRRPWGAAVGIALEYLRGNGLVDSGGVPTEKGLALLSARDDGTGGNDASSTD